MGSASFLQQTTARSAAIGIIFKELSFIEGKLCNKITKQFCISNFYISFAVILGFDITFVGYQIKRESG